MEDKRCYASWSLNGFSETQQFRSSLHQLLRLPVAISNFKLSDCLAGYFVETRAAYLK